MEEAEIIKTSIETTQINEKILEPKKRIIYLDIARTIAIILVVFCHAIGAIYTINMQEWNMISSGAQIFRTVALTTSRLGVPIFLFISGKLLLSKEINNTKDCIKFYKKNLLPLLLCTEIWIILYNIIIPIINGGKFDINELVYNMLFIKQVGLPNMWYMSMIIGVYIAIPFLAVLVKNVDIQVIKIPMIIAFTTSFIMPNINTLFRSEYWTILDLSFLGGVYGLYILLGYYIGQNKFKDIKIRYLVLIGIVAFIFTCGCQIYLYNNKVEYNVWYNSSGLLITSACLFEIISRIKINLEKHLQMFFTYVSKASLAIFFLHIVVQNIICKITTIQIINKPISILILTILNFSISLAIIAILSKVKVLKEKLLLIK